MVIRRLAEFQPARLTQARDVKELTKAELAARAGLTRQAISSFEKEKGGTRPSLETLQKLANELDVEYTFFTTPLRDSEKNSALDNAISFRSLASATKKHHLQAKVYLQWVAGLGDFFGEMVDIQSPQLPDFRIDDFTRLTDEEIETLADHTRREFGLGDGPISDLTLLLENKGVLCAYLPLANGVDGISAWINGRPITVINNKAYAARARFDLAHELGHLVLHRSVMEDERQDRDVLKLVEDQANHFGSCFMAPERTFAPEVYSININSLIGVKERWGLSIQAILMRLYKVGVISDNQKTRAFQQISAAGWRRKEPLDGEMQAEQSRLFGKIGKFLQENGTLDLHEFFPRATYPTEFLEHVTGLKLPSNESDNIIQFRLKSATI